MTDIAITLVDGLFNVTVKDGDLVADDGLETAVTLSLFSDRRLSDEELPAGENNRGWWGDMIAETVGDKFGSRIWSVFDRGKISLENLAKLERFAEESLRWMVEDNIAKSVRAEATRSETNRAEVAIEIVRPSGKRDLFSIFWDKQEVKRL